MFKDLFNLSYDRNFDEALVFYFFYVIFGYYITGVLTCFIDPHPSLYNYAILVLLVPFIFYTFISIRISSKKNLKDRGSFSFILSAIVLTLFIPLFLGISSSFIFQENLGDAILGAFTLWLFPGLAFGCIPAAILTTKEDYSLINAIRIMEREKLMHEKKIEKLLLIEREIRKTKERQNNVECEKENILHQ